MELYKKVGVGEEGRWIRVVIPRPHTARKSFLPTIYVAWVLG